MTPSIIIVLILIAFVSARLFRSTKMWWRLIFAMMAGLLVGMLSKEIVSSSNQEDTALSQVVNTVNDYESIVCTQSLVEKAVTGLETTCLTGVVSYRSILDKSFDALTIHTYVNGRDSPQIEDDS